MRELEKELLRAGYSLVVGIDEAGRGPLAGPVVAAAVSLPKKEDIPMVKDSKSLSVAQRERLFQEIMACGMVGIGSATPLEIDQRNILQASFLAMQRAISALPSSPAYCLVDGPLPIPKLSIPQKPWIKGDQHCYLIAAASIVAKVTRDAIMRDLHDSFPAYNFLKNKGYPTKEHCAILREIGPSPVHRYTFRRVKEFGEGC